MRQETVPKDLEPSPLPGLVLNTFWAASQSQSPSNPRQVLQLQHIELPIPKFTTQGCGSSLRSCCSFCPQCRSPLLTSFEPHERPPLP